MKKKKSKKRKLNKSGFTLIEVIAAITVMIILSGTAMAGITGSLNKSHNEYCTSQADMMTLAGRDYFNDNTSMLPSEIGTKAQIDLNTLINSKYIDQLKDYDSNFCNASTSKINVIKITSKDYYYSSVLDCNKCNSTDTGTSIEESTPDISFTPDGGQGNNQDITVTMNLNDTKNKIVSYRYEVYEKVAGKEDTMVDSIKQTLFKNQKIIIKLNKKGTYYIKGYAINSYGNIGYQKSKDYKLNFTLNCDSQITIKASVNKETATINKWYNQDISVIFSKKGAVESYDISISKSNGKDWETIITNKGTSYTKKLSESGKYMFKIKAYDDQGSSCEITTKEYFIDKTPPKCTTISSNSNWTNQDVVITGTCSSDGESGCDTEKIASKTLSNETNDSLSPGSVYDIAGNKTDCDKVDVKIDKTRPTCKVELTGTEGNEEYFKSSVTGTLKMEDKGGSNINSYGISKENKTNYSNVTTTSATDNTNNSIIFYGFVKDNAGNVNTCNSSSFKIDSSVPKCSLKATGTKGANNWFTSNVAIEFNSGDATSDVGSGIVSSTITGGANPLTSDTTNKTYTGTVVDKAGNSATCSTSVKRDTVYPSPPNIDTGHKITITNEANTSVGGILQNVYGNCDYACVQANRAYVDGSVNLQTHSDYCYYYFTKNSKGETVRDTLHCSKTGNNRYCYFIKRKNCGDWYISYDSNDTSGIAANVYSSATERGCASGWGGKSDVTDHTYYTTDGAGHTSYLYVSVVNSYAWWPKNTSRAQSLENRSIYTISGGKWTTNNTKCP